MYLNGLLLEVRHVEFLFLILDVACWVGYVSTLGLHVLLFKGTNVIYKWIFVSNSLESSHDMDGYLITIG